MTLLRICFLLVFTCICQLSDAQISGIIKDSNGSPIEYASVKFKNSYEGTITDSLGNFKIDKTIVDTLVIYHLSYGAQEVTGLSNKMEIYLEKDVKGLSEITVSAQYGFNMFSKCTQNTYNKLRKTYLSQSYWSGFDIVNDDTICRVDIDFDIEQKKLNKLAKEANIQCRKIQEHVICELDYKENWGLRYRVRVRPFENNFLIYKDFIDEYVCLIVEDSVRIKLCFYPKSFVKKGHNSIEVAIWKHNLCIDYIASFTAALKQQYMRKESISRQPIDKQEVKVFLKYEYLEDYCYMSYFEMGNTFHYVANGIDISRTHLSKYKVYNPDVALSEKRIGKNILSFNILESASDNYQTKFWESPEFKFEEEYHYEALRKGLVK